MLFAIKVVYYINFDHQRVMQSQLKGLSLWNNERLYIMKVPKILNYITMQNLLLLSKIGCNSL